MDVIKAKGALVIGGEKVQDVSDGARKVGEHLTACCQTQHSEPPLPPDQYLACVNGAKNYEAKIVQVSNVIIEAEKAKQEGKLEVAEQKAAEAKSADRQPLLITPSHGRKQRLNGEHLTGHVSSDCIIRANNEFGPFEANVVQSSGVRPLRP
ncbi:MAG: hypothetical protein WA231_17700 [Methylocella sp.]